MGRGLCTQHVHFRSILARSRRSLSGSAPFPSWRSTAFEALALACARGRPRPCECRPWGECPMRHPHNNRILASTALALVLAIPLGGMAINPDKLAAAPGAETPAEQSPTQAPPAPALLANDRPAASIDTPANPATATEQTAPTDPLASLDAADRAIAEKIRDLLDR